MAVKNASLGALMERPLGACFPSDADVKKYVLPVVKTIPHALEELAEEADASALKGKLQGYIAAHQVRGTIAEFENRFAAQTLDPDALDTLARTIRHYHNSLRGGMLHLAGRITEDTRLHRDLRDRIGAAGPLFAAFDEFTTNPDYVISLAVPLVRAFVREVGHSYKEDDIVRVLTDKGMLLKDEPHLERFYGVVDELHKAGRITYTSADLDQENPLETLRGKAVDAYQARRIMTGRPDIANAAVAAFMFGNEAVTGILYGKLYKGFKKFQREYGLSDHACNYFGDHASEDGEIGGPAFEQSHANLMLDSVMVYATLGREQRGQMVKGLHLFLKTYDGLVRGLCEVID